MSKFEDQLLAELINDHGAELAMVNRPAQRARIRVNRPALLATVVVVVVSMAAIGSTMLGRGSPAYAVTTHQDGTVSVTVKELSGVNGANAKLRKLGIHAAVVPIREGCPDTVGLTPAIRVQGEQTSVPNSGATARGSSSQVGEADQGTGAPLPSNPSGPSGPSSSSGPRTSTPEGLVLPPGVPAVAGIVTTVADGSITFNALAIPAGSTLLLAAQESAGGGVTLVFGITGGAVPECVAAPTFIQAPAATGR